MSQLWHYLCSHCVYEESLEVSDLWELPPTATCPRCNDRMDRVVDNLATDDLF